MEGMAVEIGPIRGGSHDVVVLMFVLLVFHLQKWVSNGNYLERGCSGFLCLSLEWLDYLGWSLFSLPHCPRPHAPCPNSMGFKLPTLQIMMDVCV